MIPYRDPQIAKNEALRGYHHTMYLLMCIRGALENTAAPIGNWENHTNDAAFTGAHQQEFTDMDTGKKYRLTLEPL